MEKSDRSWSADLSCSRSKRLRDGVIASALILQMLVVISDISIMR
jgi:hypothetical protein